MNTLSHPETTLKNAGVRVTTGRMAVLNTLAASPTPVTIKDILKATTHIKLDQVTVYRMLEAFRERGLVQMVNLEHDHSHWELTSHHHHAICEHCGKIVDISKCDLHKLEADIKKISGFIGIRRHSLEFFGLCATCGKKSRATQ
ncbi:MAG: transcriptional repressor [Candidatus Doudnabacteria bacterium]|nr:transcriptional repressor [Candidatus Doudnabacteria bacterium]